MRPLILLLALLAGQSCFTQSGNVLSLDSLYAAALAHNPLGRQFDLRARATSLELEQLDAARLPVILLNGSAQLQSENVSVPFEIPGQEPIELPLFVARLSLDAEYALYDGGATDARRQLREASLRAGQQETVTALARLKARINALFFALLGQETRREVLEASIRGLESRRAAVAVAVAEGAALAADEARLRAEILRLRAQVDQTVAAARQARAQLRRLTGRAVPEDALLQRPVAGPLPAPDRVEREELRSYALRQQQILAQEALVAAERRPRLYAFAQAGMGSPNPLNFFDEQISPFGLLGLRLSWRVFDWSQGARRRQQLAIQSQEVAVQQELFEFELDLREESLRQEMATLEQQLSYDEQLVELEAGILEQVGAQLTEGVATSADYIQQETRVTRARLQLETHRLDRLRAQIDYETEKGLR